MLWKIICIIGISVAGCSSENKHSTFNYSEEIYEKCELILDLKWSKQILYQNKKATEIFIKNEKNYKENVSKYYFASTVVHEGDWKFIFYDQCDKKHILLKKFVEKYLVKIKGFPRYEIKPVKKGESSKIIEF